MRGIASGLALSLVATNIATPSARGQSALFSLPCLGCYHWLRASSSHRLRVLRDSFAPPRLSAASKAGHCPDRQCAATWAGCSAAATCRLHLCRGCLRRIVPGGREAVSRTQFPTPLCRCCGALPDVCGPGWQRLRAVGVAREDGADRRPPRRFRLRRRIPQRGRARRAVLTYARRPLRLRVGRLGHHLPTEAATQPSSPLPRPSNPRLRGD